MIFASVSEGETPAFLKQPALTGLQGLKGELQELLESSPAFVVEPKQPCSEVEALRL